MILSYLNIELYRNICLILCHLPFAAFPLNTNHQLKICCCFFSSQIALSFVQHIRMNVINWWIIYRWFESVVQICWLKKKIFMHNLYRSYFLEETCHFIFDRSQFICILANDDSMHEICIPNKSSYCRKWFRLMYWHFFFSTAWSKVVASIQFNELCLICFRSLWKSINQMILHISERIFLNLTNILWIFIFLFVQSL